MKSSYVLNQDDQVLGMISLIPGKEFTLLAHVWVPKKLRGQGFGSRALDLVLDVADKEKVTLLLSLQPDPDSPLQDDELRDFYARHGFERYYQDPEHCMIRLPK